MTEKLKLEVIIDGARIARAQLRELSAETDKFGKQVKRTDDQAKSSAGGVGMFAKGLKGLGAAVGLSGVAFGIKDLVESGMRLQEQQSQLKSAMSQVGITGEAAYKKVEDAAVQSTEHGGFSRDQEINSIANFVRVTKDAKSAIAANQAAVELSRGAHLNFASTQRYVQQALIGNVKRLQQYTGIIEPVKTHVFQLEQAHKALSLTLTEQSKYVMANNRAAWLKNQEILNAVTPAQLAAAQTADKLATSQKVLAAVHAKFGTADAAYNKSTQGQLTNLKNTFEETLGQIGEKILPLVRIGLHLMTGALSEMSKHKSAVIALSAAVTLLGSVAFARMAVGGVRMFARSLKMGEIAMKAFKIATAVGNVAMKMFGVTTGLTAAQQEALTLRMKQLSAMSAYAGADVEAIAAAELGLTVASEDAAVATGLFAAAMDAIPGMAIITAISIAVLLLVTHFGTVKNAVVTAGKAIGHWMAGAAGTIVGAWHAVEGFFVRLWDKIKAGAHDVIKVLEKIVSIPGKIGHAAGGLLHTATFGLLAQGGPVRTHFDSGGPVGTDTIPGWLSPGEYVLNSAMANRIGSPALGQLGAGNLPGFASMLSRDMRADGEGGQINIVPGVVNIRLDSRQIAQAVVQYTLQRAARGPSSLVGGSLMTGRSGPSVA